MTFEGQHRVVANHSVAIVRNLQKPPATRFNVNHDARGAGVDRILDQFFRDRSRPLDNFASSDLVGDVIWKDTDFGH